jgi:hypothetical protein
VLELTNVLIGKKKLAQQLSPRKQKNKVFIPPPTELAEYESHAVVSFRSQAGPSTIREAVSGGTAAASYNLNPSTFMQFSMYDDHDSY